MDIEYIRLLRTPYSERHLLRTLGTDFAALEMHYLPNSTVQATLILFEGAGISEGEIPQVLSRIDEALLPEVRLDDKNLMFTVVVGRVLGAFQAEAENPTRPEGEQ